MNDSKTDGDMRQTHEEESEKQTQAQRFSEQDRWEGREGGADVKNLLVLKIQLVLTNYK